MLDLQNILMNKNIFCVFEIKCRMPVHITARHMFKEKVTNVTQQAKKIIYLVLYLLVPKEEITDDIFPQGLCKCDSQELDLSTNQSSNVKCQSSVWSFVF